MSSRCQRGMSGFRGIMFMHQRIPDILDLFLTGLFKAKCVAGQVFSSRHLLGSLLLFILPQLSDELVALDNKSLESIITWNLK